MGILNIALAAGISYIVLFGLKDREPPTVEILFPKDNYEFRTNKQIKVSAKDNKVLKSLIIILMMFYSTKKIVKILFLIHGTHVS